MNRYKTGDFVRIKSTPGIEPICVVRWPYVYPRCAKDSAYPRVALMMVAPLRGFGRLEDFAEAELEPATMEDIRSYQDEWQGTTPPVPTEEEIEQIAKIFGDDFRE